MSKTLEQLEKKVVDAKAAYTAAYVDADTKAAYVTAETKAALAAYKAAYDAYEDAEAAYVKAVDELKEYKEQDNE
jgi:phage-related tail fiber protein